MSLHTPPIAANNKIDDFVTREMTSASEVIGFTAGYCFAAAIILRTSDC